MDRLQVLIRLGALILLGAIFRRSAFGLLYLALPVLAAILVSRKGGAGYLANDASGIARILRWVTAAYAYFWLLTDVFPVRQGDGPVEMSIETDGAPTPGSALLRLVTSLPALLVLAAVTFLAALLWIMGAIAVLATGTLPEPIGHFLARVLRYRLRFFAYHLSLVREYPSFEEVPAAHAPHSGAA